MKKSGGDGNFEALWAEFWSNQSTRHWWTTCETNMVVHCHAGLRKPTMRVIKIFSCIGISGSIDQTRFVIQAASRIRRHIVGIIQKPKTRDRSGKKPALHYN